MIRLIKTIFIVSFFFLLGILTAISLLTLFFWEPTRIDYLFIYALTADAAGSYLKYVFLGSSVILGSIFSIIALFISVRWRMAILVITIFLFGYTFRIYDYISGINQTTDIYEKEYISLSNGDLKFPLNKRNIIIIYLESMENGYADPKISGENIIPELSKIAEQHHTFPGYQQLLFTHATLSGQVAGMCGIPYKTELKTREFRHLIANTLPAARCFPEILARNGYNTYFIQSGSLNFAFTGQFVHQHGFNLAEGYDELIKKTDNPTAIQGNDWGIRDREIYRLTKKQIQKLSSENKPFLVMLTTIDTHLPTTYLDPQCTKKFGDDRDVILCADKLAAEFIRWIQNQDFYDNTTIIVLGDHTVIGKNPIYPTAHNREIFNVIINPVDGLEPQPHQWTTLDLAPTILEAVGIKNNGFGLGRSLWQKQPTLSEKYGSTLDLEFNKNSEFYQSLQSSEPVVKHPPVEYTLNTTINQNTDIKKYADIYTEELNTVWTDRLKLKLIPTTAQELCLDLKFLVIFEPSQKDSQITVYANQSPIALWNIIPNTPTPLNESACFTADLIKNDDMLQLEFRRNNRIEDIYYMTTGIKEFTLFEKK